MKIQLTQIKSELEGLENAIDLLIAKADEELEDQLKDEGFVEPKLAVTTINTIEDELTDALNENCDMLLERLQEATRLDNFIEDIWPTIKTEQQLRDKLVEILFDQFTDLMQTCTTAWLIASDKALAVDGRLTKFAQGFITEWSGELADIMHLSTNKQIEKILLQGQSEAMSIQEVANLISDSGIRSPGYRARTAALTEVLRIESYSQLEYMRQDPSVIEKDWKHTGSHKNKPRPNHQAISGQRKKIDEPFDLVGANGSSYAPMCPRDTCLPAEESINCHCLMNSVRNSKVTDMTEDERRALREQRMDEADKEWESLHPELESSKIKYENQDSVVDLNAIKSSAYRNKFNLVDDDTDIARALNTTAKDMLTHRTGTKFEDLAFIDSSTGKFKINKSFDMERTSKPNKPMKQMLKNAEPYTIIGIHNHPGSTAPSIHDIIAAEQRKYKYGVVVGHDTTIFKYTITGQVNRTNAQIYLDKCSRMVYNSDQEGLTEAIAKLAENGVKLEVF